MLTNKRSVVTILSIFLAVQIAIMLVLYFKGRPNYMQSVMAPTIFFVVYTFLEARYHLYMNTYVRILLVLTIFMDAFFGYYCDLYVSSFVFDKFLHVFGTYSCSLFAYVLVTQMLINPIPKPVKFILVASLGISLGAIYEIIEFAVDNISHPLLTSQPSLLDTDIDLIGDIIGALLAAIHAVYRNFINKAF